MVKSIGMKLSGVARLVPGNFWVGSTPAQYLWSRPWPASRPFAWNVITLQFLMLPGCVIPFWKGFGKANRNVHMNFWIWAQMGCWKGGVKRGGDVAECDVVVGCILFGMHFSQSKNALLLNFTYLNGGIDTTGQMLFVYAMGKFLRWNCQWLGKYRSLIHLCVL